MFTMTFNNNVWPIALLFVFAMVLNLPFGYLRAGQPKRSLKWFLYIHLPIPFVIAMRYVMHLNIRYLPISLAASVLGQLIGGKIRGADKTI
ncbi:hypothetical protein [Candidatus Magnetobacterium casense]|uniref:hypothetical protein n=1 Tax=Candidatus Magnetobacterium casense TaxID=1455061 RepID=UPI00190F9673|nr:hypothetical protein [Candidatus Magnetobacterium casensis]